MINSNGRKVIAMHIAGFLRKTTLTFAGKRHEKDDVYSLQFSSNKPLRHIAGQHGLFVLPRSLKFHIFSLASAPSETNVMIATHLRKGSAYKQALANLQPGDTITLWGPVLDFVFKKSATDTVLLAQGIGITPLRSMIVQAATVGPPIATTLIHVDDANHVYRADTEQYATESHYPTDSTAFYDTLGRVVPMHAGATYYISGNAAFIKTTKQTLVRLGIKRSHIKQDSFLGY